MAATGRRKTEVEAWAPVDVLPGLGPSARDALAEHGIATVADLVWLAPSGFDDLRAPVTLGAAVGAAREAPVRVVASGIVKSASVIFVRGRRSVRVLVQDAHDASVKVHLFWFFMAHGVLALAKPGAPVIVVGKLRVEAGKPPRMAHPDLFADAPDARSARARYPRLGPTGAALRKAIAHAVVSGIVPDPVPPAIAVREQLPDVPTILREVHALGGDVPRDETVRAFVERLAWAEAFTRVWERLGSEDAEGSSPAPVLPPNAAARARLEEELGFVLTGDQRAAIAVIEKELALTRPMRRLVLGDVGTGKTAVALAAIAQCIVAGKQAAILAPTSVLADQYLSAIAPLVRAVNAKVAFVTGAGNEKKRAAEADVVIGTHALLEEDVVLPRLALVVVDEQQRLGVAQRLALVRKGERPHLLTLSATPIPRTLALALRGELATSTLSERPPGRKDVATELVARSKVDVAIARAKEAALRGERVFWVVPRVEESEDDEEGDALASATMRAQSLARAIAQDTVVVLHGKMKPVEKRAAMRAFRSGEAPVLVGTTVVEVGVDVPEATLMVVEDATQFGLAQLHQLRGRVGRGDKPGVCLLVHEEPLEDVAKARLDAMVRFSRGEDVAKRDLDLRGAGDLGGTRQHGAEELGFLEAAASYPWHARLLEDARAIFADDRALARPEHRVLGSIVKRLEHAIAVREEAG